MTARFDLGGVCKQIITMQQPEVPPKMHFSDNWGPYMVKFLHFLHLKKHSTYEIS